MLRSRSVIPLIALALIVAGCSRDPRDAFDARLTKLISPERIRKQLRELTEVPHRAGSPGNRKAGDAIVHRLKSAGLQPSFTEYTVRLHEPLEATLALVSPAGKPFTLQEKALSADPFTSAAADDIPYLAYVPDFDVTAEVVYANYGTREDYAALKQQGVTIAGKIALVRAQGLCRSMKGIIAEEEHLAGLLLYPELKDMGFTYPAYPEGRHINPWTVERGSMLRYFVYPGEPKVAAPGEPGSTMPSIPALPVSEETATQILELMQGPPAPADWKGWLKTSYRIGLPGPTVRMTFRGNFASTGIRNIFASIPGIHPDEPRVLIGCHYDAWMYGAADPASATAVVLETADVLSEMYRAGWKPRRGVQFAFWDAEEFGMFGSTRWVEENIKDLRSHVSAYLSIDTAVRAKDFVGYIQPGLRGSLDEALQRVPDPGTGRKIFDLRGEFAVPGFSGDVAPFTSLAGIPTGEIAFGRFYPVYHSIYDDYRWFTRFADPDFKYSAALTRILALYSSAWTDDTVLPYRFTEVAAYAAESLNGVVQQRPEWRDTESWKHLDEQIRAFHVQAERLEKARHNRVSDQDAGKINDHLHEAFLSFSDMNLDYPVRNALIGPSEESGCTSDALPGLQRSLRSGSLDQAAAALSAAFLKSTAHLKQAADLLER